MTLSFPSPAVDHLAVNHDTAVGMQALPGNHTAVLTRQENKAGCNLRRLRRTTHRRGELLLRRMVHGGGDQGSPDGAGADGIDADPSGDLLVV